MTEFKSITINNPIKSPPSEFIFNSGEPKNTWIIKINNYGIFFNHDEWPDSQPSDFAKAFMELLERNYDVKFTNKSDK